MIRKNLLKATLITTIIACILTTTACGKKSADNNTTISQTKATVSAETKSNAAKELTKTGLVTFDYTDEDGNTYTLEGKAVANESGDATIEVSDASGNKVSFTGKAKTVDGKLSVSDIAVKDAGTLVKADGTEIKVSTGTTVADANESTGNDNVTDIAASDDVKNEVETAKKEESVIEAAREEVTKAEESVKADDENNNDKNNDTIIADNGNNGGNENTGNNTENNNTGDSENTGDNGGNTDDNNTSDSNNTPSPSEPEETPTTPSDPEPTPAPVNPTPAPEEEKSTEAPTEKATHMETKYIYFHDFNGGIYFQDSVTYLAYEDGTPVNETTYSDEEAYAHGQTTFPDSGDPDKFVIGWYLIDKPSYVTEEVNEKFFREINLADYSGNVNLYPGWI